MDDLSIDPTLVGAAMRDQLIIFYNRFAYWGEQHGKYDAEKKVLENILEEAKDKARAIKAQEATVKDLKAKIQEAHIKDFWEVPIEILDTVTGEIKVTTCSYLSAKLGVASKNETITRHKMNICSTFLEIGRTAVSWDKTELQNMDTGLQREATIT
jgi:hypothetical protein